MRPKGKCYFHDAWLSMPEFKQWLAAVPDDKFKVRCTLCRTNFNVSGGGITSVKIITREEKSTAKLCLAAPRPSLLTDFFFLNLCRLVEAVIRRRRYVLVVVVPAALALPRLSKFFLQVLARQIPAI